MNRYHKPMDGVLAPDGAWVRYEDAEAALAQVQADREKAPADLLALMNRLQRAIAESTLGYTARFDAQAERFYNETGFMAPGKSVPMEMQYTDDGARHKAWDKWQDQQRTQWREDMRAVLEVISDLVAVRRHLAHVEADRDAFMRATDEWRERYEQTAIKREEELAAVRTALHQLQQEHEELLSRVAPLKAGADGQDLPRPTEG